MLVISLFIYFNFIMAKTTIQHIKKIGSFQDLAYYQAHNYNLHISNFV